MFPYNFCYNYFYHTMQHGQRVELTNKNLMEDNAVTPSPIRPLKDPLKGRPKAPHPQNLSLTGLPPSKVLPSLWFHSFGLR